MHHQYTAAERRFDGVVHVLGMVLSGLGAITLLGLTGTAGDTLLFIAAAIYSLGLIATFWFSAAYNLSITPKRKTLLRRFDHAAIYVMIAGTYTPLAMISIGGTVGYGLLALVWSIAGLGLVLKLGWPHRFERLSVALYLALGWVGLFVIGSIIQALPVSALILLLIGGIFYTTGVIFHLWTRLPFQNAIWHCFVLVAAVCHYAAVVDAILPQ
ncbi:Hly-III family protein [Magnetospirillum molischianum DSM 120]|uniref:Hly-III family protein n=2 Tax=Magnetospirillum molischianum TaxID=1083 RepID=H8FP90_MAGML|nr:Hly-III family protein [Magnetospirillum molischianum DSM 120]